MRERYPCESHPDYSRWLSIKQRCRNPKNCNYKRYGAKGIDYADEFDSFEVFAAYIASLPGYGTPGVSLDRKDGSLGYVPGNLQWSSQSHQVANQLQSGKGNNRYTGINWSRVHHRWVARINLNGKSLLAKIFLTQEDALHARNQFILDNKLPHPIQIWSGE